MARSVLSSYWELPTKVFGSIWNVFCSVICIGRFFVSPKKCPTVLLAIVITVHIWMWTCYDGLSLVGRSDLLGLQHSYHWSTNLYSTAPKLVAVYSLRTERQYPWGFEDKISSALNKLPISFCLNIIEILQGYYYYQLTFYKVCWMFQN